MIKRILLLTLLLISPLSFADWGDVYYCQITTSPFTMFGITVDTEKVFKGSSLEKKKTFTLKVDKSSKALILRNKNVNETFERVLPLKKDHYDLKHDWYMAEGDFKFAVLSPQIDDGSFSGWYNFIFSWLENKDADFVSNTWGAECERI